MIEDIRIASRAKDSFPAGFENPFSLKTAKQTRAYHAGFPEYSPTPLVQLHGLAKELGAAEIYIKDESKRFGLNAF